MTEVFDSSDPKAVKEAVKSAKAQDAVAKEGLLLAMRDESGRAWLYKVLKAADVYANPFTTDALRTAFRCGEINIGQQIIVDMHEASPDLYLLMLKENQNG